MWWCDHGGYLGRWGRLLCLLWFALLGLLVYWIVRTLVLERRDRALEVLRERTAIGAILSLIPISVPT
ncbi:hypothetical protein CSW26_07440 [Thermus scotoductus]|uniref:hypothetical protein n=1 Tax=Thermus scotoductus TaxID=37636 RepID=UPI000F807BED|nr:hypothetical protein [Thermus scotoductus]RTI06633.1 hypothetical protein CSW26_07435 [Thermus scotoductus]RTI06634.1 hypothetical protein CSW26_07440 [Thermus scotoductus]